MTKIHCPAQKLEFSKTAFEKAFLPEDIISKAAIRWLEREANQRGIHIHHALCGHGGECFVDNAHVNGYHQKSKTVFQYHGCIWHGCPKCFPYRNKRIPEREKTFEEAFQATSLRTQKLRQLGYDVVEAWDCEVEKIFAELPQLQTRSYPHTIFYDFETFGDKNKKNNPTAFFTIEDAHVPISVSVGDTLKREPTHICDRNQAELIRKFVEELK